MYLYSMRSPALFIAAFLLCSIGLKAQAEAPYTVEPHFWKPRYYQDTVEFKLSDLIVEFDGSGQADELIRKANNQHDLARFCQLSGAFLVLYPIVNEAIGGEANYAISFIGAGLIGISVPLELKSRHIATQAIMAFNQRQKARLEASLLMSPTGIGFRLQF